MSRNGSLLEFGYFNSVFIMCFRNCSLLWLKHLFLDLEMSHMCTTCWFCSLHPVIFFSPKVVLSPNHFYATVFKSCLIQWSLNISSDYLLNLKGKCQVANTVFVIRWCKADQLDLWKSACLGLWHKWWHLFPCRNSTS